MKYKNNLLYKYAAIQPNGQSVTKYQKKKKKTTGTKVSF